MKSFSTAAIAALMAGMATAQPHRHGHGHAHAKRELVTEWETVWETVTVLVDESTTQTLEPTHVSSGAPGEFFQPPPSSTPEPEPQPQPEPTTVAKPTSVKAVPTTTAVAETTTSTPPPPPPPAPTTTSTSTPPPPPPKPTTTEKPAPPPAPETTVQAPPPPPPATTDSSEAASSGSSYAGPDGFGTSSLDKKKYSGDITYYALGLGSCGYDDSGVDQTKHIVAISQADWYSRGSGTSLGLNMPNHPWCDQTITITANGKTTTALVHDICPGCESGSIDVSESVFTTLFGGLGGGREAASWQFN
ncbi:hypothetical protein F4808DRAFT_191460 [Astrocystis sublimbata]|nr:hypothetical protein F4808DRAFT_191460 [Astrocystis sublimbata]